MKPQLLAIALILSMYFVPTVSAQSYTYTINPMHQTTHRQFATGSICSNNPHVTTIKYVFRNPNGIITGVFQFPPHSGCVLFDIIVNSPGVWTVTGIYFHGITILHQIVGTVTYRSD